MFVVRKLVRMHLVRKTYDVVVLAADSIRAAGVAGGNTNDGNGGAVEADLGGHVLEDDAKQAQEGATRGGVSLLNIPKGY